MLVVNASDIASRIRAILARSNGPRRIAIAAFVGADAAQYAGEPEGLHVYCWPHPGSTNPDGLRALKRAGARIWFVERPHMKIYWSDKGGCLVGSPNLSANALDDERVNGLIEGAIYFNDSSRVDIDAILKRLKPRREAHYSDFDALEKRAISRVKKGAAPGSGLPPSLTSTLPPRKML